MAGRNSCESTANSSKNSNIGITFRLESLVKTMTCISLNYHTKPIRARTAYGLLVLPFSILAHESYGGNMKTDIIPRDSILFRPADPMILQLVLYDPRADVELFRNLLQLGVRYAVLHFLAQSLSRRQQLRCECPSSALVPRIGLRHQARSDVTTDHRLSKGNRPRVPNEIYRCPD